MQQLKRALIWLSRIRHCRGFGIQSPTDFRFVRYVVTETSPYYAYDEVGKGDGWLKRKLGLLCFRLANERQPHTIVDDAHIGDYLHAACRKAQIVANKPLLPAPLEMAILPTEAYSPQLFCQCNQRSLIVFHDTYSHRSLWHQIEKDPQAVTTFDLYYFGIALFDQKRSRQNYIVNI